MQLAFGLRSIATAALLAAYFLGLGFGAAAVFAALGFVGVTLRERQPR